MRVPGVHTVDGTLSDVHISKSIVYIFNASSDCFVGIDYLGGKTVRTAEYKRETFRLITGITNWYDICCVEHALGTFIFVLFKVRSTNEWYLAVYQLKIEEGVACLLEEHFLGVKGESEDDANAKMVKDESGDYYCILYWRNQDQQKTTFCVIKLRTDDTGKVLHEVAVLCKEIECLLSYPFIFRRCVIIFLDDTRCSQTVAMDLQRNADERYSYIYPDLTIDSDGLNQYPPDGTYSRPCVQNDILYWYISSDERKTGEFWALDLSAKKWRKYFELVSHGVTERAAFALTTEGISKMILHGKCVDESCNDRAHFYHFSIRWFSETIYPTIQQWGAILSQSKIQIYYGPSDSDKSLLLSIKALITFQTRGKIKIFTASHDPDNFFALNFASSLLSNESDIEDERYAAYYIFIDGLSHFTYKLKRYLLRRQGKTVITLDACDTSLTQLSQPRTNEISWYYLESDLKNEPPVFEQNNAKTKLNLVQSMDAMEQFYGEWWSNSLNQKTILIPSCQDVFTNRYFGPTDSSAAGFDQELFNKRNSDYRGQKAECGFLQLFQKLDIGGVLISGFNSSDYAKAQTCYKDFKKGIPEFEIDALFLHSRCGIVVFEIKATEREDKVAEVIKKAVEQLEKMKQQLPIIFNKICNAKITVPMHFALCFLNTDVPATQLKDFFLLGKSSIHDEIKFRDFITSNMNYQPKEENALDSLKIFTSALAGYRSLDFLSSGHNALSVNQRIDSQNIRKQSTTNVEDGIFLTNEQLEILQCNDQNQMISGPPGTGKTLILLRKALAAARIKKKGNVYILIKRAELTYKFRKFFEKHNDNIVRLPIIIAGYESLTNYSAEDDIFTDESDLNHFDKEGLASRSQNNKSGQTVIVLTGLFNPLQVKDVVGWLRERNLTRFRYIQMKTVMRSSKQIFTEWQNEFDDFPLHHGHNIIGPGVQRTKRKNSNEILEMILHTIREIFGFSEKFEEKRRILLGSLCIITDCDESCLPIKSFLTSHKVPCGSIEEQIVNQNLAAVCKFDGAVSLEWPIVIVVSMINIHFPRQFFLIAASRCIAKLIVIERDFLDVMKQIDQRLLQSSLSGSRAISNAIISDERKNGETENYIFEYDTAVQLIRWNFLFTELRKTKVFEN